MTQGAAHGIGCIECQRQHTTVAALVDKTGMVRLLVAQSVEIVLKKNMICGRDYLSQVDLDCVRVEAARLKVVGARQSVYGRRVQAVRARKYIRGAGEIVQIKVAERGQQQNSREHFDRVAARDERQAMDAFADHRSREGMSRHHLDVRDEMEKKRESVCGGFYIIVLNNSTRNKKEPFLLFQSKEGYFNCLSQFIPSRLGEN